MQHGSRSSKLCHSAVLNKQLIFEIHHYAKKPIAYIENDAVGCYDRITNPLVLIFLRIIGLSPSATASLANTWEQTYHRIRMLYGISEEIYGNSQENPLYGPGQGSTIGPFLWLLCFILIFMLLPKNRPAISLTSVSGTHRLDYVGEAFVDDTGLGANASGDSTTTIISNLQTLAQPWEKLLFSTGGALDLSKCFWFLLSWEWVGSKARLHSIAAAPGNLVMTSENDPTPITIPRLVAPSTFRTLGVHISPSGTNTGAFSVIQEFVLEYCTNVKGSHLSWKDSLMSYVQYLLPKLRFQPPVLSFTQHQCDKLMTQILWVLLPNLHINRNTARSIIFGPEEYGGLALPDLYVTQGTDKLRLFLGHLRLQDCTGHLIHIDLMYLQLLTGWGSFFMNLDAMHFRWVEDGWLSSLWQFTSKYHLSIMYPHQWLPPKPRLSDQYLMEIFARQHLSVSVMATLNRCRLFLQVFTVSDIATVDGTRITMEAKQGIRSKV
jgi:hypothetical protein